MTPPPPHHRRSTTSVETIRSWCTDRTAGMFVTMGLGKGASWTDSCRAATMRVVNTKESARCTKKNPSSSETKTLLCTQKIPPFVLKQNLLYQKTPFLNKKNPFCTKTNTPHFKKSLALKKSPRFV